MVSLHYHHAFPFHFLLLLTFIIFNVIFLLLLKYVVDKGDQFYGFEEWYGYLENIVEWIK